MQEAIVNKEQIEYFERYWKDSMFPSALKDVHREFRKKVTYLPKSRPATVVLYVLMMQAMITMLDGYSGRSNTSDHLRDEAIGLNIGLRIGYVEEGPGTTWMHTRYMNLYQALDKLKNENPAFETIFDDFANMFSEPFDPNQR